jgi:hypothetical protein
VGAAEELQSAAAREEAEFPSVAEPEVEQALAPSPGE